MVAPHRIGGTMSRDFFFMRSVGSRDIQQSIRYSLWVY